MEMRSLEFGAAQPGAIARADDSGRMSRKESCKSNASQPIAWREDSMRRRGSVPELDAGDINHLCLVNHVLENLQATMEGWKCDLCLNAIPKGENFRGCAKCCWGKCRECYAKRTCGLVAGQYVEVIQELELDGGQIEECIRGTVLNSGSNGATISFMLTSYQTKEFWVPLESYPRLKLLHEPSTNVRLIVGALVIGCLFIFGICYEKRISFLLARLVDWCKTLGWGAPVLIFVVSSILPVIMLPVFPMMALSGPLFTEMHDQNAVYGGAIAFVSVFGGLWLGSVTAFALGKTLFREFAAKASRESKYLQKLNRIIDSGGTKIVLMARSLPILPAEVFDYACALTNLQIWQYAIGCLGSALPVAFWTFSSAQATVAAHSSSSHDAGRHICLIVLNVVVLLVLTILIAHTINSQEPEGNTAEVQRRDTQESLVQGEETRQPSIDRGASCTSMGTLVSDNPTVMSMKRSFASTMTLVSRSSANLGAFTGSSASLGAFTSSTSVH